MIDVSCFVGPWPFRTLSLAEPEVLRDRLVANGITRALVSPLGAVLQRSAQVANRELAARVAGDEVFAFVPVVNPAQGEALAELDAYPDSPAVRLLPGPHGYALDDPAVVEFVRAAGDRGRTVIVQVRMIDVRMAHPDVVHRELTADEVRGLAAACPKTSIVVAGARPAELAAIFAEPRSERLWCELSHCEQPDVVRNLINSVGVDRLLCGTHAPVHVVEALPAKLFSADLSAEHQEALARGNARAAGLLG